MLLFSLYRFLHSKSSTIHLLCQKGGKWIDILGNEDLPTCESKFDSV